MKGIQYLTDPTGNKTALLIDLQNYDERLNELLEDMMDVVECESLEDEPTIPFEEAVTNLYKQGKVSKKVFEQVTNASI